MSLQIVQTATQLKTVLGRSVSLVPTMGNLHDGHLALVRHARAWPGPVVASIFVNRLQFAPGEDFDTYPRTFERDCELLEAAGCDVVFAPRELDLYPQPQTYKVQPDPALADILEGASRPGFFTGVCTVVMKLFIATTPARAVFGKKDYQQLMIVRRMVEQFGMPIEILGHDTVRAADGLALSSRNSYLAPREREAAQLLSEVLKQCRDHYLSGAAPASRLEHDGLRRLRDAGWQPDYLRLVRRADLQPPTAADVAGELVWLVAARLGSVRLIDNLEC